MNPQPFNLSTVLESLRLANESPTVEQIAHLSNTIEQARPYSGPWTFPWLLTPWESAIWKTTNGTKTRRDSRGDYIDTANIKWDILLPDGRKLTDPSYARLLETCRKLTALHRNGFATRYPPAVSVNIKFISELLKICNWLVLEKSKYHPAEEGMRLLDQAGIKRLLVAIAQGGWCEANSLVDRFLVNLHLKIFSQPISEELLLNPVDLPQELRENIIEWLENNNGFYTVNFDSGRVSRKFVGQLISAEPNSLSRHSRLDAVLRQFEKQHQGGLTLVAGSLATEYPNQKTKLMSDASNVTAARGTVNVTVKKLRAMLSLYRHLPDQLPSPSGINLPIAASAALSRANAGNHTPFIPIDTGLKYLKVALEWVVLYGEDLVDYVLVIIEKLVKARAESDDPEALGYCRCSKSNEIFIETPVPKVLKDAGFSFASYSPPMSKARDFDRLRKHPALDEALSVLVGAVTITIGLLKPSRDFEIRNLPRDCLRKSSNGAYWLNSKQAKRGRAERRAEAEKPIPYITALAIKLMHKLNRGLVRIFDEKDSYKRDLLFYLPNSRKLGTAVTMNSGALNPYLNIFCDYVGLPPDEYGRRWYVRIHEMRKWFLLLLFWSGRYEVLDAARWIAGHTQVEHLYAYIEREFPGAQLGKLEAECVVYSLARYDESRVVIDEEDVGLVELYERVLRHFRVKSLSFVKESEWHLLVEELFENDFHLEPYTIVNGDNGERLCVAVRIGPRRGS